MPRQFLYKSDTEMAQKLAVWIAADLNAAVAARRQAVLILPGGSSPVKLITTLANIYLPWEKIIVTTTDERQVPLEDVASNAGQIKRLFAEQGADIEPLWLMDRKAPPSPSDVTVLGLGLDGHFASIFPGQPETVGEGIVEALAPAEPRKRLSLTPDSLLASKRLILLIPDALKWTLCRAVLAGERPDLPLARLIARAKENLELHIAEV